MVGWGFLFMLVIIVLGWRERKKNFRKFSEIENRLAQVEELLLEVCALVEEKLIQEELPPLPDELAEPESPQEPVEQEEPAKPEELGKQEVEETREVSNQAGETKHTPPTTAVQREQPILTREQPEQADQPVQPEPTVSQSKTPAKQGSKQPKGKKAEIGKGQKLPPWKQQIIELRQQGLSVQEIARQIEKGQGEVQLIIDLYCAERPQS